MDIQFCNFLENAISNIVSIDKKDSLFAGSGKKNFNFKQSRKATEYIDAYITDCQTNIYTYAAIKIKFNDCLDKIRELASVAPL